MKKKKTSQSSKQKPIRIIYLFARGTFVLLAFFVTLLALGDKKEATFQGVSLQEQSLEKEAFIAKIASNAQLLHKEYGVLPSISISQAILESNWGTSGLVQKNKNYYGIKGATTADARSFKTKEFNEETGDWIEIDATFRAYESWEESMEDHARLLVNGTNWNPYLYQEVLAATSYKEAAYALQKAGYATDPKYPEKLIGLIEQYDLAKFDTIPGEGE